MSTLYVIRHGQASFGKGDYDKLSEQGIQQSRILGESFLQRNLFFDVIYCGTMVRHRETLETLLGPYRDAGHTVPEIINEQGLNEYDSKAILSALVPELVQEDASWGRHVSQIFSSRKSFQMLFEAVMDRWITGRYENREIESWSDYMSCLNRAIDGILSLHGRGKSVAVITSGGPVAAFVKRALNLDDEDTLRITWQVVNTSVTRFKATETEMMMATFNEHVHLEEKGDEGMVTYR